MTASGEPRGGGNVEPTTGGSLLCPDRVVLDLETRSLAVR